MQSAVLPSTRISKGKRSFEMSEPHFTEDGLMASRYKQKRSCQHNDDSEGGQEKPLLPFLPEDVWSHIHSLMHIRDAGQAACLSRSFLWSWRCHPYLIFTAETLGCKKNTSQENEIASNFYSRVDNILNNHLGIGVKALKIQVPTGYTAKDSCYLNRWLQIAITPGIEELELTLPFLAKYKFPYSLLPMSGDSIKCLELAYCSFRPTSKFGWLKNLTKLCLDGVFIRSDELERLLSSSLALERLEITFCDRIVYLKVSSMLQRLTYLEVCGCEKLRVLNIDAPNISCFKFERGHPKTKLSIGGASQIKELCASFSSAAYYVRAELPSVMANLETLSIYSNTEMNIPVLPSKYLHLKYLRISLVAYTFPSTFDYFSLASFFDACPSLEDFLLNAYQQEMKHVSIITDPLVLRRTPEQRHHKLKTVQMIGFTSAKSLVELACHIAQCATSLQYLKLEVQQSNFRCYIPAYKCNKCSPLSVKALMESRRAYLAIMTYIEPIVPSTVKLQVVGPCSRCHALEQ